MSTDIEQQHLTTVCCKFEKRDWLKLISNIGIPLIIGIFTVVVAIHQQNVPRSNREKDAVEAAELRQKDLETALLQRRESNEIAQSQRAEDKEIARLQRELDLNMTIDKLAQENQLAEKQRNLSISQRTHELQIVYQNHLNEIRLEDERQKENTLVTFQ
jgi:cell division protein FtsN